MKKEDVISEEQLNAFTDGELEAEEESQLFELAEKSPELDARLCQQRKLKEMVQHAYRDVPVGRKRHAQAGSRSRLFGFAAAATMLLALGTAVGWISAKTTSSGAGGLAGMAAQSQSGAYLVHLRSSEPEQMDMALRRAGELMKDADGAGRRVEIVVNEGGLDLLRSDITPYAERIKALAERDVLFFACSRAIERLERMGVKVELLPEANTHYTALDRVVLRMQQGWEYVKI